MAWANSTATPRTEIVQDVRPKNQRSRRKAMKVDANLHRVMHRLAEMRWSNRKIARELGLSEGTVKAWLRRPEGCEG